MTITAQEYLARIGEPLSEMGRELLAALRHHEANEPDAALGALVRRILAHPEAHRGHFANFLTRNGTWTVSLTERGLSETLAHLDSLLPKEPEVVTGPSGKQYRKRGEVLEHFVSYPRSNDPTRYSPPDAWERLEIVTLSDAPVVAKLMAGGGK